MGRPRSANGRGGVWGTGRFRTLSGRRGLVRETWFPRRERAAGERRSSGAHATRASDAVGASDPPSLRGPERLERRRVARQREHLLDEAVLDPKEEHLLDVEPRPTALAGRAVERRGAI